MTEISPGDVWPVAPARPLTVAATEVHLWLASLKQPPPRIVSLRRTLASDEIERAKRFRFDRDRDHYIVGRGVLRSILSRYLKLSPAQIVFEYSAHGKPALAASHKAAITFNLSHAGQVALYAVTRQRPVGVDVEQIRPMPDSDQIAARYFSAAENEVFSQIPPPQKEEAFFNCWTRKEAYIKAIGEGLSHPLDTFDVSLRPGEPAKLLAIRNTPPAVDRWSIHHLRPAPDYVAALVVEGQGLSISCWRWST